VGNWGFGWDAVWSMWDELGDIIDLSCFVLERNGVLCTSTH
jgi:hypothetical protein